MEIDSVDKLVEHIRETGAKFITIDGRDGSGKTTLSQKIHKLLGGTLVSEEAYRSSDLNDQFTFNMKIKSDLEQLLKEHGLVIFESVLMQRILENIGIDAELKIYVKRVSSFGLWRDDDEIGGQHSRKYTLDSAKRAGASNFRLQMINYHYDFEPHRTSDVIYLRQETSTGL